MTTLVEEQPFAAVVIHDNLFSSTCAKCFTTTTPLGSSKIVESFPRCLGCHIVHYCGKKCQKKDWKDHKAECELLRQSLTPPHANIRLVSRMILRANREPDFKAFNGRTWNSLMDNVAKKMEDPKFLTEEAPKVFEQSKAFMGELTPSLEEVLSAHGKMRTNGLPIFDSSLVPTKRGYALYIGLSVLDHSCRPDCYSISKGSTMLLRTTKKNVEYSDQLTISYLDLRLPQSTSSRRSELYGGYMFICKCEECQDEELDAKRQSGLCQFCSKGSFFLESPVCSDCEKTASPENVEQVKNLNKEIATYILEKRFPQSARGEEGCRISIAKLNSSLRILPMHNSSIYGLAESVIGDAFSFDAKLAAKYIDFCFPFVRELPRGMYRSYCFCFRIKAYKTAKRPFDQRIKAVKEAIEEVEVTHGKHLHTANVKIRLNALQLAKDFGGKLNLKS